MAEPIRFQLNDGKLKFVVERLKVKESLKALKLLGSGIIPALATALTAKGGEVGPAARHLVETLDTLPEIYDLFVARTKYANEYSKGGAVPLEPFAEDVFGGHPDLVLEYVFECVKGEFGSFLSGEGRLGKMLREQASKLQAKQQTTDTDDSSASTSTTSGQSSES